MKNDYYFNLKDKTFSVPGYLYGYIDDDNIHIIDSKCEEIIPLKHLKVEKNNINYVRHDFYHHDMYLYGMIISEKNNFTIIRSIMGFYPNIHLPIELTNDILNIIKFESHRKYMYYL